MGNICVMVVSDGSRLTRSNSACHWVSAGSQHNWTTPPKMTVFTQFTPLCAPICPWLPRSCPSSKWTLIWRTGWKSSSWSGWYSRYPRPCSGFSTRKPPQCWTDSTRNVWNKKTLPLALYTWQMWLITGVWSKWTFDSIKNLSCHQYCSARTELSEVALLAFFAAPQRPPGQPGRRPQQVCVRLCVHHQSVSVNLQKIVPNPLPQCYCRTVDMGACKY